MTSTTFDWNRVRAFLAAAEQGSFSAAARQLGLTQPTVGRQVSALEEALGVTLFERLGHRLEPTAAGVQLLEHAREMGQAATKLSLSAAGQSATIDGSVRITASQLISAFVLGPAVRDLRSTYPGLRLELVASNQTRDLRRREADIAVRNHAPQHADLTGRRLPDAVAYAYAHRSYVEHLRGRWEQAEYFGFEDVERMREGLVSLGIPVTPTSFTIITDDHLVQWALAKQGLGICLVMEQVGANDPDMVRVFEALPGIPVPMWLVTHRELHTSQRIRVVFDALVHHLHPSHALQSDGR